MNYEYEEEDFQAQLSGKTIKRMFTLALSYFDRTPVGWIMSRVMSDSGHIAELITWGAVDVTWAVMSILTAAFFMLLLNWQLGLVVLTIIPVLVIVASWFQKRIIME